MVGRQVLALVILVRAQVPEQCAEKWNVDGVVYMRFFSQGMITRRVTNPGFEAECTISDNNIYDDFRLP